MPSAIDYLRATLGVLISRLASSGDFVEQGAPSSAENEYYEY